MQPDPDDLEVELALLALRSRGVRARLLAAAAGRERYAPLAPLVADFFGISRTAAEAALECLAEPTIWKPMSVDGMHWSAAPGELPGRAMFVRVDPGVFCPAHVHWGEERLLVLEGRIVEDTGVVSGPGDLIVKPAGSRHALHVPETGPCVSAYRIVGEVSFS